MTPEEALRRFQQVTGLQVFAVLDRDGTAWWAKGGAETPTFECTIGDRTLHIDELASAATEPPPAEADPFGSIATTRPCRQGCACSGGLGYCSDGPS